MRTMPRKLLTLLLPFALALFVALSGCGGGGGGGGHTSTSTSGGDTGTVVDANGIVRDIFSKPAVGAKVTFFNASGTSLGTVTIASDGQAGTPPAGATKFSVDVTSVTSSGASTYYDTYLYNGLHYDAVVGCNPSLTSGAFASSIVFTPRSTDQAPAAPDGCS